MENFDDSDGEWEEAVDQELLQAGTAVCLFCEEQFLEPVERVIAHIDCAHNLDLKKQIASVNLEEYEFIKMINFIRLKKPGPSLLSSILMNGRPFPFEGDEFLKPVLEDDPMLWLSISCDDKDDEGAAAGNESDISKEVVRNLTNQLADAHEKISKMTDVILQLVDKDKTSSDGDMERSSMVKTSNFISSTSTNDSKVSADSGEGTKNGEVTNEKLDGSVRDDEFIENDSAGYFASYDQYGIHEEMLKDEVRTGTYKNWIMDNRALFDGKIVLDIGCGTGILSLFAASAGASRVYAVDNSVIIYDAMEIILENKMDDVIKLTRCRVEEFKPDSDRIDIIISEWMGYFLLYESMLASVIEARDKFGATMVLPNIHRMFIQGVSDPGLYTDKVAYWSDVYGYKMSAIRREVLCEPLVRIIDPETLVTDRVIVSEFDINKIETAREAYFIDREIKLTAAKSTQLHAIVGFFESTLDFCEARTMNLVLSTSPTSQPTHWKQTVMMLPEPVPVSAGEDVKCVMTCVKTQGARNLCITIELSLGDYKKKLKYTME